MKTIQQLAIDYEAAQRADVLAVIRQHSRDVRKSWLGTVCLCGHIGANHEHPEHVADAVMVVLAPPAPAAPAPAAPPAVEHGLTTDHPFVGGEPATRVRCLCGWTTVWVTIQDGSAQAEGHDHMMAESPEYRRRHEEHVAAWRLEQQERAAARPATPAPAPARTERPPHRHNCSCHLSPPCGACENCKHPDGDPADCENDCQTCEVDHDL